MTCTSGSARKAHLALVCCVLFSFGCLLTSTARLESPLEEVEATPLQIDHDVSHAMRFGAISIGKWERLERTILSAQAAAAARQRITTATDAQAKAKQMALSALLVERTTIQLNSRFCHTYPAAAISKCAAALAGFSAAHTTIDARLRQACAQLTRPCTPEQRQRRYRDAAGGCNHPRAPSLGRAHTVYKRLLPAAYADGVAAVRRSVARTLALPSARLVSDRIVKREADDVAPGGRFTVAFAHWGAFVERDLAETVARKMVHFDSGISCCAPDGSTLAPRHRHPFCSAIDVPAGDQYYGRKYVTCLDYVRSATGLRENCSLGPLDQLNQATHYLDASHIYGSDAETTAALRNGIRGQMRHAQHPPPGDARANSHPQLRALHALFLREHNRLAERLAALNPHWDDERLFEEARRILIAEVQHITYHEWLPLLAPSDEMDIMAATTDYHEDVDPAVSNSFATAAIRFTKSLIPASIQLFNEDRTLNATYKLGEHLHSAPAVEGAALSRLLRGLTTQKGRKLDLAYAKDLIDSPGSELLGADVISADIQRGRDHGLPGYNAYRKHCGLRPAQAFDDLLDNIAPETVRRLAHVYHHPDDIDLVIGGLAETPKGGAHLGDTFACILADQFRRTRAGDRYFYAFTTPTHAGGPQPWQFTPTQVGEIERASLARIVCDNAEVRSVQMAAFLPISSGNALVPCEQLPAMRLAAWRE